MPITYRYYASEDVPVLDPGDSITHAVQASIPNFDHDPHSTLTYDRPADQQDFRRYSCVHQEQRNVDAIFNQQEVRRAIFNERFQAFYNPTEHYFLVQADKRRSHAYFERLALATPPLRATPGKLDLERVMELGHTTGGWFSNVRIAGVKSAGLFGAEDIGDSPEWERYSSEADMSAVYVKVESRAGSVKSVMITKDRVVLVMKDEGEQDNLDLVAHLNEAFVRMGCVIE